MKFLITVVSLFFASLSLAGTPQGMPSFSDVGFEKQLEEKLPEYRESEEDEEGGLIRFRAELESYRKEVLEGFNFAIIEYRNKLVESDRQLESDRSAGNLSRKEYLEKHEYIKSELSKSKGSGEYMQAYFDYLGIYRTLADWVINQLAA